MGGFGGDEGLVLLLDLVLHEGDLFLHHLHLNPMIILLFLNPIPQHLINLFPINILLPRFFQLLIQHIDHPQFHISSHLFTSLTAATTTLLLV